MASKSLFLFLTVISALIFSPLNESKAEERCKLPQMLINERPGNGGPPTEVTLGILVSDITGVDDVAQTLTGDFMFEMRWKDERLADLTGCRFPTSAVWNPQLQMFNSSDLEAKRKFNRDQVEIEEGGVVRYFQRATGAIATYHHLADFPFDSQNFRIRIASLDYNADNLILKVDEESTLLAELINIPDWTVHKVHATAQTVKIAELREPRSIYTLIIPADRNSSFYIWKILVPMILIVMMSWVVFWINPVKFGPQLGLSATAMLTLIAFQFAQTGVLPKLSYFTTMDKLILGSSILVFLSFFESAAAIYFVSKGADRTAINMDIVCRWLFPLLFVLYWGFILL
jgi:hypothetical protein